MTISDPPHWIEQGKFKGIKYDKIKEMIAQINANEGGAPGAHKTTHQDSGSDEISVEGLSGDLADLQDPKTHKASHENGGADEISVAGLSGILAVPQVNGTHEVWCSAAAWQVHQHTDTSEEWPEFFLVSYGEGCIAGSSSLCKPITLDINSKMPMWSGKTITLTGVTVHVRNSGAGTGESLTLYYRARGSPATTKNSVSISTGWGSSWTTVSWSGSISLTTYIIWLYGIFATGWTQFADIKLTFTVA